MKKFFEWINGNKTTIGAIALMIVNSEYIESLITNPDLYTLLQGLAMTMLAGGLAHKVKKAVSK